MSMYVLFSLLHCTIHVVENQSPGVAASQSVEHPERASIGGDSVASSEYETVSLFEETGRHMYDQSISVYMCSKGGSQL